MTDFDRARAYVAKMPPAVSGQGGHDATFAVAKATIHDFALSESEAWQILCEYNGRCSPPWSERELRHKVESVKSLTRAKRERGALANNNRPYCAAYCPISTRCKPMYATETEPRILGQISIEMFEGPKPPVMTPAERLPGADPRAEQAVFEELTGRTPTGPLGKPSPTKPEDIEAKRIAGEFMAALSEDRWSAKVLTGNAQPRTPKDCHAFLMVAFEPGDTFDFSNPDDMAEFEKLYRRKL
jgi:hypothetical protein